PSRGGAPASSAATVRGPPWTCLRSPWSHARDQPLDAFVVGTERVLAQDGALRLVVQLQVHPVDGEVAPALLGVPDELTAQPGPGGLRRPLLRLEDLQVGGDPVD